MANVDAVQRYGVGHVAPLPGGLRRQRRHHGTDDDALKFVLPRRTENPGVAHQIGRVVVQLVVMADGNRNHICDLAGVDTHAQGLRVRVGDDGESGGGGAQAKAGVSQPVNVHIQYVFRKAEVTKVEYRG